MESTGGSSRSWFANQGCTTVQVFFAGLLLRSPVDLKIADPSKPIIYSQRHLVLFLLTLTI